MDGSQIVDIPRLEDWLIGRDAVVSRTQAQARGPCG